MCKAELGEDLAKTIVALDLYNCKIEWFRLSLEQELSPANKQYSNRCRNYLVNS